MQAYQLGYRVNAAGQPLNGGKAYFYLTTTTTLEDVFEDPSLDPGAALSNPVIADSAGFFPELVYLDPTKTYRCVIKTSANVTVSDADPINTAAGGTGIAPFGLADLMQVALLTGGYAAIAYASTAGGGSNVLPQGVTALSAVGVGTGSGGTPGVNIPGGVSGGPAGFAWTYDIGSGGKISAYRVTNTGRASTTTAPTLTYPTGGVTGATVPVATVSTTIPVGGYYATPTADSAYLALWTNSGTGVPVAVTGPDGNQVKEPLKGVIDVLTAYNALLDAQVLTYLVSKNLYNPAAKQAGIYVGNSGVINVDAAWGCTDFIAVTPGQSITISANAPKRSNLAFYSAASGASYVSGSVNTSSTLPLTVTVPSGAAYLVVNLYSNSISEPSQVQIEVGASATAYEAWHVPYPRVAVGAISPDITAALAAPGYVTNYTSPNLFDTSTVLANTYLDNAGGVGPASGWGSSAPIPVTAGLTYTISGTRGREGVAFYTSAVATSPISGSYSSSTTLPLTLTAPAGATHMRVNLYSSSSPSYSNVQVQLGAVATDYEAYGVTEMVQKAKVYPAVKETVTGLKAVLSTSTALGSSSFSFAMGTKTVKLNFSPAIALTHTAAQIFQLYTSKLDGVLHAASQGDDIAPYRVGGATIGAGHGYNRTVCNLTAHGKTAADLYSEWQDGSGNRWIIVLIDSANAFSVTAKTGNSGFAGGALTHVAGATNTGSVTPSSLTAGQLYPSINNRNLRLSIDGVSTVLASETVYPRGNITFLENYEVLNKDSMVAYLIANRAGADIPQPGGTSDLAVSNSYRFDDQGIVQTNDFLALQSVAAFQDIMFIQCNKMDEGTGNGTLKYYVPNALAFTQDAVAYDFANGQDMTGFAPIAELAITPARSEVAPALLPDRVLQVNDVIGLAVGILPVQSADPAVRRTNAARKALEIRNTSKKIYLSTVDNASKTSLTAGDYYSAVTYRRYFDPTQARWIYTVPYGAAEYVYIHWYDKALTDVIPMPAHLAGRPFTLIDSHNATVKSGYIGAALQVAVSCAGGNAHAVLLVS